jgi:hypothetical protein
VFNHGINDIILYDMHAHVYHTTTSSSPPLASVAHRELIESYQTNSILAGGKVYEIKTKAYLPIELTLEISRLEGIGNYVAPTEGMVLSIFGLYIDYHVFSGELARFRIPSNSIFCFQNS